MYFSLIKVESNVSVRTDIFHCIHKREGLLWRFVPHKSPFSCLIGMVAAHTSSKLS